MADVDVKADTGDTLRVRHRDGSITLIVWLEGGEAVLFLPPFAIKELSDRRRHRAARRAKAIPQHDVES